MCINIQNVEQVVNFINLVEFSNAIKFTKQQVLAGDPEVCIHSNGTWDVLFKFDGSVFYLFTDSDGIWNSDYLCEVEDCIPPSGGWNPLFVPEQAPLDVRSICPLCNVHAMEDGEYVCSVCRTDCEQDEKQQEEYEEWLSTLE